MDGEHLYCYLEVNDPCQDRVCWFEVMQEMSFTGQKIG